MIYEDITDEEFKELGYSRERAEFMYALNVEADVVQLRKRKMGLQHGDMIDFIKYLEVYDPNKIKYAHEYMYDYTMEMIQDKKNEISTQ